MNALKLFLLTAYSGPVGDVAQQDIGGALRLMGQGMLGILVVMGLIWLLIFALNKLTVKKKPKDEDEEKK